MKENRMRAVLESIARRDVPVEEDLWPRIAARVERKNFMQMVRTRPALVLFLVLLALILLSGVAYAIGKVTGYIPRVGIVDQSAPVRILAAPVAVKRDGVTVTIGQVVADSNHTFVGYAFDGIPMPANGFPMCGAMPSLQLPNGSNLDFLGGGGGGFGGGMGEPHRFETTASYPPIPSDVDHVTFVLRCVLPKGTGPENWQIPLDLVRAPEGFATPGIEIGATFVASGPKFSTTPTPTLDPAPTPVQYDPSFPHTPTPVPHGSGLYLERVIELQDSYILFGNFTDAYDLPGSVQPPSGPHDYLPKIEDALGNEVEFKVRGDIQPPVSWGNAYYWAYEIAKPVHGPLKITLDQINIIKISKVQFNFETGSNPQTGQVCQLNLPVHVGPYEYIMDSVEMAGNEYLFKLHSDPDIPAGTSLDLAIPGSSWEGAIVSSEEDHGSKTMITYSYHIIYPGSPPTGHLTVEATLFEVVPLRGPWTLAWTPPGK